MSVVLLDDVKTHLNITNFNHDFELQSILDAAEAVLAQHVGPLAPVATVSRVTGGRLTLVLPVAPVISITSVTPVGGTALTLADFQVDAVAGLVTMARGGIVGYGTFDVAYQAGRATMPADLALAVKELTRHLWESQRGPARFPGSEDPLAGPSAGFLLSYRVQELIAPHRQFTVT